MLLAGLLDDVRVARVVIVVVEAPDRPAEALVVLLLDLRLQRYFVGK